MCGQISLSSFWPYFLYFSPGNTYMKQLYYIMTLKLDLQNKPFNQKLISNSKRLLERLRLKIRSISKSYQSMEDLRKIKMKIMTQAAVMKKLSKLSLDNKSIINHRDLMLIKPQRLNMFQNKEADFKMNLVQNQ